MVTNSELAKEVDVLRKEVVELRNSLSMFNELYEAMKIQQEGLAKENKELARSNQQLTKRVAELEQYSRLNNVEIKGVPQTQGEDCCAILKEIGEKIGCPVESTDIDVVHRVPAKHGQNIIARFCSRTKKGDFAAKAKKARLTASSLGLRAQGTSRTDEPVFINDHLTPENKRLFAQALALKKEKQWQFLWVDNCRIKARKGPDSRVYRISGVGDLAIFA